jgi:hypothetical protein
MMPNKALLRNCRCEQSQDGLRVAALGVPPRCTPTSVLDVHGGSVPAPAVSDHTRLHVLLGTVHLFSAGDTPPGQAYVPLPRSLAAAQAVLAWPDSTHQMTRPSGRPTAPLVERLHPQGTRPECGPSSSATVGLCRLICRCGGRAQPTNRNASPSESAPYRCQSH